MSQALFRKLLIISRPRFWTYLAGTFLLGAVYGVSNLYLLQTPSLIFFFLWFTFPANLFVYGINDIYDYDTDSKNPKKNDKEALLQKEDHSVLKSYISIMITLGILLVSLFYSPVLAFLFLLFLFLSGFYSARPIRAKAIPFLDTVFNSLYIIPGLIGYFLITNSLPPSVVIIAGICWCMGMHAYSAIPDIQADEEAKLQTVATILRKNGTLLFCAILYSLCAFLIGQLSMTFGLLLTLYPLLMLMSMGLSQAFLERFYWVFPWINAGMGMILVLSRLVTLA